MISARRFLLRMFAVTVALATTGGSFVFGYFVGYKEAVVEWSFKPAIVQVSAESASRGIAEIRP